MIESLIEDAAKNLMVNGNQKNPALTHLKRIKTGLKILF